MFNEIDTFIKNHHFFIRANASPYRSKLTNGPYLVMFYEAEKVGSYRGEDSGAWYSEYDEIILRVYDITSVINEIIDDDNTTLKDLYKQLVHDGATWPPYNRHQKLIHYLLNHDELIQTPQCC